MKYIITKNQYKILVEDRLPLTLRRRLTEENLQKYINKAIEILGDDLCEEWSDEYDYADAVISEAFDEFVDNDETIFNMDIVGEELEYTVKDTIRDLFGDEILDNYRDNCEDSWA